MQEEDDKLLEEIIELPGYHTLTMELLIKTAEADSKRCLNAVILEGQCV